MIRPRTISGLLVLLFVIGWTSFFLVQRYQIRNTVTNDYDGIKQAGVLRVCGEYDPFSFYSDASGQHGFHYELIQTFASLHGLKLVYLYQGNFEHRLKWLESGTCDVLTGPLPVMTSLKKRLAYTTPLYTSRLVLVQRSSDKPIRNQVDLASTWLTLPAFSPNSIRINHLSTEISDSIFIKPVRVFTSEELVKLVLSGKEHLTAMDERVANALKKSYPDMDCSTPLSMPQFQAWAVRPGSTALLDSLDAFIDGYKKSPAYERLLTKW